MADDNTIPDTPPEGEADRTMWAIRRMVKSLTGQTLSEAQAKVLYDETRQRIETALKTATPE